MMRYSLALIAFCVMSTTAKQTFDWSFDQFVNPFVGEHTGVKVKDLNGDGFKDLLFAAGRHSIDQSYALLNLGPASVNETDDSSSATTIFGGFRWSKILPIGTPGGYYQVDVAPLKGLEEGHVGVLLAGGICTRPEYCPAGLLTPAVVLDAMFFGCSALDEYPDPEACQVEWKVIWTETPATGNRNGALSTLLGEPGKPVIVLVGGGRLTVTHWSDDIDGYPAEPDYVLLAEDKILDEDDDINRSAGLAVGFVGTKKAIVLGPRTIAFRAPAPVIIVYQDEDNSTDTSYSHYHVEEDNNPNTTIPGYAGNPELDVQPTGIDLADFNGDGNSDIVPANFFNFQLIEDGFPLVQPVYLVDEDPKDDTPLVETTVFEAPLPARVVTSAQLFNDSELPDLVYGMLNGDIILVANKGVDPVTGDFLGFEIRQILEGAFDRFCTIRDIQVASLGRCSISIIAATICFTPEYKGNVIYTAEMPELSSCTFDEEEEDDNKHSGGGGDPHIQLWDKERMSFHGECDLVMASNHEFHDGNGIDLQIRTTIQDYFSYIETVALRIKNTTIEFYSDHYFVNGEQRSIDDLPFSFGIGNHRYYSLEKDVSGSKKAFHTTYVLRLDKSEIKVRFYKQFGNVEVDGNPQDFSASVGLLGNFSTGEMLGRQGQVMDNVIDYGFEWQVIPGVDPVLFLQNRAPQLPYERCRMPTAGRPSRRLRGNEVLSAQAEEACAKLGTSNDFALCVEDVVATGDPGLAELW